MGVSVGCSIALIILALTAAYFIWRFRRQRRKARIAAFEASLANDNSPSGVGKKLMKGGSLLQTYLAATVPPISAQMLSHKKGSAILELQEQNSMTALLEQQSFNKSLLEQQSLKTGSGRCGRLQHQPCMAGSTACLVSFAKPAAADSVAEQNSAHVSQWRLARAVPLTGGQQAASHLWHICRLPLHACLGSGQIFLEAPSHLIISR